MIGITDLYLLIFSAENVVGFYLLHAQILALQIPRKMMLQTYNLLHAMARNDRDCDFYHR